MATKTDFSWLWLLAIGGGLYLLSRQDVKTSTNGESTTLENAGAGASINNIVADDLTANPIIRDYSRVGPDGIRNSPTYPTSDIIAAEETTIDNGNGDPLYFDFLGKQYYPR